VTEFPTIVSTDVGRSCILLTVGGKNLMLDCGMHMGYNDDVSDAPFLQFISEYNAVRCVAVSRSFCCSRRYV